MTIAGAFFIARWQAEEDRANQITNQLAAAEVAGSTVADLTTSMWAFVSGLEHAIDQRNQGKGFDAPFHLKRFRILILPTETQMMALAPVINAGAISLARGVNRLRDIERTLIRVIELGNGTTDMVFKDMAIQGVEPIVKLAIKDLNDAKAAFIDLLAHKVPPVGRHVIQKK